MSRTVDANVLLYASDASSPHHGTALATVEALAEGTVMAYLRIATHPAVFARPLPLAEGIGNVDGLLARPHVRTAGEGDAFWPRFQALADDARPTGNLVPDTHLAALMLEHGVGTIVTRDRDFRRFRGLAIEDPFA
jgi:toxin-antitoxin system PIN domain toxin